ncbi:TPA: hypothetical protein ACH3X2_005986 [Trebouxia sp. C0005]
MHTAAQTGLLSFEGSLSRQASQSVCKAARAAPDPAASLVTPVLPRLPACKHFLNLTNGVEAVPLLESLSLHFSFVRIQSTWCEQQRFDLILANLDAALLLHLALGHCCLVWDFASRNKKRGIPRALWYGLEFVNYVLRRLWFQRCTDAWLRRQNVTSVFEAHYNDLQKTTVAKLRYYMRYIPAGVTDIHLYGVCKATVHDPDPGYYRDIVHKHLWNGLTTDPAELQSSSQQMTLSDAQEIPTGVLQPSSRNLGEPCMLSLEPCD